MKQTTYDKMERRLEKLRHQYGNGGLSKEKVEEMKQLKRKTNKALEKHFPFEK